MVNTPRGMVEVVVEVNFEIKRYFESFFKERIEMRPIPEGIDFRCLEREDVEGMEIVFSEEEVKGAIWSCEGNKTAGTDGYTIDFFKKNWELVKEDVMMFVADFHSKFTLTKACTTSFIALIPKVKNPQLLAEYRPVFLVGSLYKILSKLMAERLKKVVSKIISTKQSAFIKDRNLMK